MTKKLQCDENANDLPEVFGRGRKFHPFYHFVVVASLLELQISVLGFKTVLRKDVPLSVYGA